MATSNKQQASLTNPSSSSAPAEYVEDLENLKEQEREVFDEAEIASKTEANFLNKALEAQRAKMQPQQHPDFDGIHCVDCDIDLPELRLAMGRVRCTDCQNEEDRISAILARQK